MLYEVLTGPQIRLRINIILGFDQFLSGASRLMQVNRLQIELVFNYSDTTFNADSEYMIWYSICQSVRESL
jgi:hypothetical protein